MHDLFQRFQVLPGLYSAIADQRHSLVALGQGWALGSALPYFDLSLSFQETEPVYPNPVVAEANQILQSWADEWKAVCDRSTQEMAKWIEPIVIDRQIWAYPDVHAVMRVPVKGQNLHYWEVVQPFRIRGLQTILPELNVLTWGTATHGRSVATYSLVAVVQSKSFELREQIEG